jgi:Glu-tRNA(Gln) amidotransferase subunit E-like FAD-binding protein
MLDYKKLGLKVGLEIHRQMDCGKLFSRCDSILSEGTPELKIKRYLQAVVSETGESDIAAQHEMNKERYAIYECFPESSSLIEQDEQPPLNVDEKAFQTALQVSLLLNMEFADIVQVMRKQVLDYSNTSGFQRTMLLSRNGSIETPSGKVRIETVCLEEDSARKIKETPECVVYRLDRLGIPLIEIATAPDIKTPSQAQEVASYLGMLLKSTGMFKSGIGTIRQDLNISIKNHPRVEIKGVQDLKQMPLVIEKEIARQLQEIKSNKIPKSHVRRMNPDASTSFLRPMPGKSRMYIETDHPNIEISPSLLKQIKLPELLTEKTIKFEKKYNLSSELAREVIDNNLFEVFAKTYKLSPSYIAKVLVEIPKEIRKRFKLNVSKLKETDFKLVFENVSSKKIPESAAIDILTHILEGKRVVIADFETMDSSKLEIEIKKILQENKGAPFNALMGEVMKKFKGKIDGKKAAELLKKFMQS